MKDYEVMKYEALPEDNRLGQARKLSLTERLTEERNKLTMRIAEIDEVLTAMQESPGIEKVINLIFAKGI